MKSVQLTLALTALSLLPLIAHGQTAEELFRQGRHTEARTAFEARVASNPNDAAAHYHLGRIAESNNESKRAVEAFEKAVKLDERNADYHHWLGAALGQEAQKASKFRQPFLARRIKSEFERAVQLDPAHIEARLGLIQFYTLAPGVMGGSVDRAREQAAEIVKLNPVRGHLAFATIAQRQKDVAGEEAAYKAAAAAVPDSTTPYYQLAAFYRRQSRFDEAFALYEKIMAMKPGETTANAGWGFTAAQSGTRYERGEREIRTFLANPGPNMATGTLAAAHFRLGQIHQAQGRADSARARYDEAIRINPGHADAKKALASLNP